MARIQYQPSRKSKGFAPIQISTEGINRMREESNRIVRGLQNVREAEAKQRAAELASIKEDSAYQERILKENRNTLIQNQQNKQQQRAYNQETKQKEQQYKQQAVENIFEGLLDFSTTLQKINAQDKAEALKQEVKEANALPSSSLDPQKIIDYSNAQRSLLEGGVRLQTEIKANAVQSGESPFDTARAIAGAPGLSTRAKQINDNNQTTASWVPLLSQYEKNNEKIYDTGNGEKFSYADSLSNPYQRNHVLNTIRADLIGYTKKDSLYLSDSLSYIDEYIKKEVENAGRKGTAENNEITLQQADDLATSKKTEDLTAGWVLVNQIKGPRAAHDWLEEQSIKHNIPTSVVGRIDLNGDIEFNSDGSIKSGGYVNTWPNRINAIAKGQRSAFVKQQNEERKFAEAEDEQWLLQNIDDIRESFLLDPSETSELLKERYHSKGFGLPSLVKEIEREALKQLADQARAELDTKIRFGTLDETYINSISDPTTRKLAIQAKQAQDERKYGPVGLGIKKGFRATARKLTDINPNEGNDSPQTFLVQARLEIEYAKALETTQDPLAANEKVNQLVDAATAGDKNSPFYSESGTNNRLVFTNIEKSNNEDQAARNLMIDQRMKTYGAEVASQAFVLADDTEMDATILSAQSNGTVTYPKGVLRVADKFGLKPSEVFNQQQQARNLSTGINHPLLTPSLGTEFFDNQNPVTRRLLQSSNASQINRGLNIGLNNLQNSIRGSMGGDAIRQRTALQEVAGELGVDPIDLATIIGFETGGTYDPGIVGGEGNNYEGLIQMGEAERNTYGFTPGMTFEEQLRGPVLNYFKDRFAKAGMSTQGASLEDLYTTVIAGNPGANRDAKDSNGTSARSGVSLMGPHRQVAIQRFGF